MDETGVKWSYFDFSRGCWVEFGPSRGCPTEPTRLHSTSSSQNVENEYQLRPKGQMVVVFGEFSWLRNHTIDFATMTMSDDGASHVQVHRDRRDEWSFYDAVSDTWSPFQKIKNVGGLMLINRLSSDIEEAYVSRPTGDMKLLLGYFNLVHHATVDFDAMVMTHNETRAASPIKREEDDGNSTKSTGEIEWSFLNDSQDWFPFGKTDAQGYRSTATSVDIERHYQMHPRGRMIFTCCNFSRMFSSVIDFAAMKLTNQETRVVRRVRRVWKETRERSSSLTASDGSGGNTCQLFLVDTNSAAYARISKFFHETAPENATIRKIFLIQNTLLKENFYKRKKVMTTQYRNDANVVNETRLFHGTPADVAFETCKQNFNRWLEDANIETSYGIGVYFSNQCRLSGLYSTPNEQGCKYVFTAKVLVGRTVRGNSSMIMPPYDSSGVMYDCTTDSDSSPTVFVKYHDDAFYPEYLIEFT